jgi:hypothetical protein
MLSGGREVGWLPRKLPGWLPVSPRGCPEKRCHPPDCGGVAADPRLNPPAGLPPGPRLNSPADWPWNPRAPPWLPLEKKRWLACPENTWEFTGRSEARMLALDGDIGMPPVMPRAPRRLSALTPRTGSAPVPKPRDDIPDIPARKCSLRSTSRKFEKPPLCRGEKPPRTL